MKSQPHPLKTGLIHACAIALWLVAATTSQAGLTLQLQLIDNGQLGAFTCSPNLSTNANGADATPTTYHQVRSPHDQFIGDLPGNGNDLRNQFPDFNDFTQELTNGAWRLILNVGATNEQTYSFTVSITNLTTNSFGTVVVDFPLDGATNVPALPNFEWHGPADWDSLFIQVFGGPVFVYHSAAESLNVTNASLPPALVPGNYNFGPDYQKDASTLIASSIPLDASNNAFPGWVSSGLLDHGAGVSFQIPTPPPTPSTGHSLVAHYPFDGNNFTTDTSGNGNDIQVTASFSGPGPASTTNSIAGGGAALLNGTNWFILPTNLLQTIGGSYSISLWLNTTQSVGANNDQGNRDLGIVWADVGGGNDSVPMAETGSKLGFFTGGPDDTVNSITSINSGPNQFTHIVVTRDQATGAKRIYINGNLDASDTGGTNFLNASTQLLLGMNPFDAVGVDGVIDDVQFYSGVLNGAEVAMLYQNPGTTAPNVSSSTSIVAHYTFDDPNNIGADSSGNGFDLDYNGGNGVVLTTDAKAGGYAASFDGNSYLTYSAPPTNVMAAFAGNFTLSLWIKTSESDGDDGDPAWEDTGIVAADIPGQFNDIIPMALTGGAIAFGTGPDDDHINSTVDINDGLHFHHVVVTRNQATGEKQMYIDGVLNTSDFATTNLLSDPFTIGIGAAIDASETNAAFIVDGDTFNGSLDDLQLYSRVLSASEVAFLFSNPGQALATAAPTPVPVTVSIDLSIYREQDPVFGDIFAVFPAITSVDPAPVTSDTISSPNGDFNGHVSQNDGGAGSSILGSLDELIGECTNGLWTLTINQGDPSEHVFHFNVSITGLDTNLLTQVQILVPTNGAVNVPPNTPFQWANGPGAFAALDSSIALGVQKPGGGDQTNTNLSDLAATNWPSPPLLQSGTHTFSVDYQAVNVMNVTFTIPVDSGGHPVSNWVTQAELHTTAASTFTVAGGPAPVRLTNPLADGTNFQFSFQSQSGFTNRVQYNTNLLSTNWLTYTNVPGDGSVKTLQVPLSVFGSSKQGFVRIHP